MTIWPQSPEEYFVNLSDITDAFINRKFDTKIVARGFDYFHNGAVDDAVLRGDVLTATVEGSEYDPYQVQITFGKKDIASASCDCPYETEWGGWCKHIAAVLLVCAHAPENVTAALPLTDLLATLDRAALETLVLRVAQLEPGVVATIASEAERLNVAPGVAKRKTVHAQPMPDARSLRSKVRQILGEPGDSLSLRQASAIRDKISDLFQEQVERRVNAKNVADALFALDALTDEYVNHWYDVSAADDLDSVFPYIGSLWERAFTQVAKSLTPVERSAWKEKLRDWDTELSDDYGVDDTFTNALTLL